MKKYLLGIFGLIIAATIAWYLSVPHYRNIDGFSQNANKRIETFLKETRKISGRKVAVFDIDGTLLGQVPYYLADEALYAYATENQLPPEKLKIINKMQNTKDNAGIEYVSQRIEFLSGLSADEIKSIGNKTFKEKFSDKIYPEMKQLVHNLQRYNIEVWAITASPEFLYKLPISEHFGIPETRIIGIKSVIHDGITTADIIRPLPQEQGKADTIYTFIQARPIFAAGNSRGDMEMVNESIGLKFMVNPDDNKTTDFGTGRMETLKQYRENDQNCVIVRINDTDDGRDYTMRNTNIKPNQQEPKTGN